MEVSRPRTAGWRTGQHNRAKGTTGRIEEHAHQKGKAAVGGRGMGRKLTTEYRWECKDSTIDHKREKDGGRVMHTKN